MPAISHGKRFKTLKEFLDAKKAHAAEQGVPYVVGNSKLAQTHNKQQVDQKKCMPESLRWKKVTMKCKHNGSARCHPHMESTEERPNQSLKCAARPDLLIIWWTSSVSLH